MIRQADSPGEVRKALLTELQASVKDILHEYIKDGEVLRAENPTFQRLFVALEKVFLFGLKEPPFWSKSTFGFWNFIEDQEKSLPLVVRRSIPFIKGLSQINSTTGRGRAWIRLALNEGALEEYFKDMVNNHKAVREWYRENSVFRHEEDKSIFLSIVVGLNTAKFALTINDFRLNHNSEPSQGNVRSQSHTPTRHYNVTPTNGAHTPHTGHQHPSPKPQQVPTVEKPPTPKTPPTPENNESFDTLVEEVDADKEVPEIMVLPQRKDKKKKKPKRRASSNVVTIEEHDSQPLMKSLVAKTESGDDEELPQEEKDRKALKPLKYSSENLTLLPEFPTVEHGIVDQNQEEENTLDSLVHKETEEERVLREQREWERAADMERRKREEAEKERQELTKKMEDEDIIKHEHFALPTRAEVVEKEILDNHIVSEVIVPENIEAAAYNNHLQQVDRSVTPDKDEVNVPDFAWEGVKEDVKVAKHSKQITPDDRSVVEECVSSCSNDDDISTWAAQAGSSGGVIASINVDIPVAQSPVSPAILAAEVDEEESVDESIGLGDGISTPSTVDNTPDLGFGAASSIDDEHMYTVKANSIGSESIGSVSPSGSSDVVGGVRFRASSDVIADADLGIVENEISASFIPCLNVLQESKEKHEESPVVRGGREWDDVKVEEEHVQLESDKEENNGVLEVKEVPVQPPPLVPIVTMNDAHFTEQGKEEENQSEPIVVQEPPSPRLARNRAVTAWAEGDFIALEVSLKGAPEDQNWACFGCGKNMKGLLSTIRYCEYTGKYYCKKCHHNDDSVIPARIVRNWDCKKYKVCVKAKEYIRRVYDQPLINLRQINPSIYRKSSALAHIRQLLYIKDFLLTCREKDTLINLLGDRFYMMGGIELFSVKDLVDANANKLVPWMLRITTTYVQHITSKCERCKARGFICEFCNDPKQIYSFQLKTVLQCPKCRSFFHIKCYDPETCPKCIRLQMRRLSQVGEN